jgi:hypothetical protein
MAENRITTVLVEVLSSGGQSQVLTTTSSPRCFHPSPRPRRRRPAAHAPSSSRSDPSKRNPTRGTPWREGHDHLAEDRARHARDLRHGACGHRGGFTRYLFGPENRLRYDIAGTLGNGSWGYIVGIYEKDAGANNQRLYLNSTRVAQMSDTHRSQLSCARHRTACERHRLSQAY